MTEGPSRPPSRPIPPPFGPALLLGLALKPLRPSLLQPVFDAMLRQVRRRHPDMLERLADYAEASVCIDPVDLPFMLLLEPRPDNPRLTVRRAIDPDEVTATIRGPLEMLIALAEGKVDGDALFFSRRLLIEGDTEVVLALRNAIDGAGIDLIEDFASALGPFGPTVRRAVGAALALAGRVREDFEMLRASLIAPAVREADLAGARVAELEAEIRQLRRQTRRGAAGA